MSDFQPHPQQGCGPPYRPRLRNTVNRQRKTSLHPDRAEQALGFRGWTERGYLPHRDEPGLTQLVTFRLADSFPTELRSEWEKLFQIEDQTDRRAQLEAWLDLGKGVCHLQNPGIADLVAKALTRSHERLCEILSWVIMPNHVHALFKVHAIPMSKIIQHWKGTTGMAANRLLQRSGAFWQKDYWDTFMRDEDHQNTALRYLRNNPVRAGLVRDCKDWPWAHWSFKD